MQTRILLLFIALLFPVVAFAGYERKVEEFPDGPAKDAINAELESCGFSKQAAEYFHIEVKRYSTVHTLSGLDAAIALCINRRVCRDDESMGNQDEWEADVIFVP